MPHVENSNNETYDFVFTGGVDDGPFTENETAVTDSALVTVENATAPDEDEGGAGDVGDNETTMTTTDDVGDNDTDMDEVATATFENQTSNGTAVNVSSVTLPEDGYVAIHNDSLLEGNVTGSVIGVSEYLEAGTYENLTVELFNVSGANFTAMDGENATLEENQSLIAMPHIENSNNETYDFVASEGLDDGPFTADGVAVTERAFITVEANATSDTETETNSTQLRAGV